MSDLLPYIVGSIELTLALAGAILLWRFELSPSARRNRRVPALPPWDAKISDFFVFLFYILAGSVLAALGAGAVVKQLPLRGDSVTVFNGAAAQLGMLLGVAGFWMRPGPPSVPQPPRLGRRGIFKTGAATFLIALPVLMGTAKAWEIFLEVCGLPTERQDLIGMFANADSIWLVVIMLTLAIVIAPLTEELVFRAGLFRFLRTRIPHAIALVLPAIFFATLHVNWETLQGLTSLAPLTVLAVVFSIAYERTGQIGTSIVAHALFNLNTVVLIFSGVGV